MTRVINKSFEQNTLFQNFIKNYCLNFSENSIKGNGIYSTFELHHIRHMRIGDLKNRHEKHL